MGCEGEVKSQVTRLDENVMVMSGNAAVGNGTRLAVACMYPTGWSLRSNLTRYKCYTNSAALSETLVHCGADIRRQLRATDGPFATNSRCSSHTLPCSTQRLVPDSEEKRLLQVPLECNSTEFWTICNPCSQTNMHIMA